MSFSKLSYFFVLIFIFVIPIIGMAQDNIGIDDFYKKISNLPDSEKVDKYIDYGQKVLRKDPTISIKLWEKGLSLSKKNDIKQKEGILFKKIGIAYYYLSKYDTALYYYNEAIKIFEKVNNFKEEANSLKNIGIIYLMQGNFNKAIEYYNKALKIFEKANDKKGLAGTYLGMSGLNFSIGNYSKALAFAHKALKYYQDINDSLGIAKSYGNIGNIHADQENFAQALRYYRSSLKYLDLLGDKFGVAKTESNIGSIYNDIKAYKKAIPEFEKAITIFLELGNDAGLADAYSNLGKSYENLGKYNKALDYYLKALEIRKKLDDRNGIIESYNFIANLNTKRGNYAEAIKNVKIALRYAKEIGAIPREKEVYKSLFNIYEKTDDYKKAFEYIKLYMQVKDTLFNIKKAKALEELETKYQVEKKEQELEKQRILLQKKEAEAEKQKVKMYALFGVLILMILLAVVIYINLQQKKRTNELLAEQKARIEQIHSELKSSITYAKRIQRASLPSKAYLKEILPDYFILFKPRDIVSGDFYWWRKIDNKLIVAVADCTGHGVPGALMSMLGLSLLKESIINERIFEPKDILEFMRKGILDIFSQQQKYNTQDGIDMIVIALDMDNLICEYAGANNPLFVVRNNESSLELINDESSEKKLKKNTFDSSVIYEINPDRMPVGNYYNLKPFSQKDIKLLKGDMLYLMTDGYADQFGGQNYKKFTKKRLRKLLAEIAGKEIRQQSIILNKTFEEWKNGYPQTDDVTIMGIKI